MKEGRQPVSNILLEDMLRMFPEVSETNIKSLIFIQTVSFLLQVSS